MRVLLVTVLLYLCVLVLIRINDASMLSLQCPSSFCLNKQSSNCTCTSRIGSVIQWTVFAANGSKSGVIRHVINESSYNMSERYPLTGNSHFVSVITSIAIGNVSATLHFTPTRIMKNYVIQCKNNISSISTTKDIKFHGPPSPPLNITALSFTQTQFLLSWDRPINHSCVDEYIVDSPNMNVSSLSTNNTNITLTTSSNESFTVRVASVDYADVKSNYSHYICIKLTVPGNVSDLVVVPYEEVYVSFIFTHKCNPTVTSHSLITNISNDTDITISLPSPISDFVINGATPGLTYTVQVAASNPIGLGAFTTTAFEIYSMETSDFVTASPTCTQTGHTKTVVNPFNVGLLVLGYVGGLLSSLSVIYCCYCVAESRKARKEQPPENTDTQVEDEERLITTSTH